MFNDKFNKPFVDFLNENFDKSEHLILCKRLLEFPFPQGENVIEIKSLKNLDFTDKNVQKIICHSLFDEELIDYLYDNKNILYEKAYWGIWGGDLYNAKRDEKNDYVRKNFKGYITDLDKEALFCKYKTKNKTVFPIYCIPSITIQELNIIRKNINKNKGYLKVQINNSSDESTIEILEILSKYRDENIRVSTILSYGDTKYKDAIIEKGKKIFGDKFEYLDTFLSIKEYAQYLASNDIIVFNQNRQQGIGNIRISIALGVKTYIKSNISSYKELLKEGIKVYNTESIKDLTFDEFCLNLANNSNIDKYFDLGFIKKQFEDLFYAK